MPRIIAPKKKKKKEEKHKCREAPPCTKSSIPLCASAAAKSHLTEEAQAHLLLISMNQH